MVEYLLDCRFYCIMKGGLWRAVCTCELYVLRRVAVKLINAPFDTLIRKGASTHHEIATADTPTTRIQELEWQLLVFWLCASNCVSLRYEMGWTGRMH